MHFWSPSSFGIWRRGSWTTLATSWLPGGCSENAVGLKACLSSFRTTSSTTIMNGTGSNRVSHYSVRAQLFISTWQRLTNSVAVLSWRHSVTRWQARHLRSWSGPPTCVGIASDDPCGCPLGRPALLEAWARRVDPGRGPRFSSRLCCRVVHT